MKLITFALTIGFSLACAHTGFSADTGPCGNGNNGGTAGTGRQSNTGPSSGKGEPINIYTGNEFKRVDDLQIWGAVGTIPMVWSRHSNSRAVAGASLFGVAHYWRHSFQWELSATSADATGRAQVVLIYPDGAQFTFTEVTSGTWQVTGGTATDYMQTTQTGMVLVRKDSAKYFFTKYPSGNSYYFLMTQIQDSTGNGYAVTYNSNRQVATVTEPAGRFFKVSYTTLSGNKLNPSTLATLASAPAAGAWMEFTITNTSAFRYVYVQQADGSYGNLAEVEFYEAGTNARLSGTVISSDAAAIARAALDGDKSTAFVSSMTSGGYVGYDLGAGKKVGKVRVLSVAGKEALQKPTAYGAMALRVFGANVAPLTTSAIAKVETNDGRAVNYEYTPFNDPTLPYVFPSLTAAAHGDGTRATYTMVQVFPGSRPLVGDWDDVRSDYRQCRYRSVYQNGISGAVLGAVMSQVNLDTGGTILQVGVNGGNLHQPMVTYSNAGSEVQIYTPSSTIGAVITQEIDQNKNATSYTYDAKGFMATRKDPLGRITQFTWDSLGHLLTRTNPDGTVESWTYNAAGLVLSQTDALGRVTSFTRDASNRVTQINYPDGSSEGFTYNNFSQIVTHQLRNGGTESFVHDSRGLLTQKTDPLGYTTQFAYDTADRLASVTDALGHTTTSTYNERGLVTQITNPDSTTRTFAYTKYGYLAAETNELGNTRSYSYDVFNRVASATDPLGRTTITTYQPDSTEQKPSAITSPSGSQTTFSYDLAWHLVSTTVGAGSADAATTTLVYDKMYNVVKATDALGKASSFTYDARYRKISAADPLGNVAKWTYDAVGNVLTSTNPNGGVTTNSYDAMDRLVSTTDANGQTSTMTYDQAGNALTMTDPKGSTYGWTYDRLNRRTSMLYPGGSSESYRYDAVGNPVTYTTRAGQTRSSVFDVRNREIQTNWSDATPSIARTYDAAGRVLTESNGVCLTATAYDAANQITSETNTVAGQQPRTVGYAYDADGRRVSTSYPGGNVVATAYTARNQVSAISLDGSVVASYEHDLVGDITAKHLENSTDAYFVYDAAHRLTSVMNRNGANLIDAFSYTLDKNGNRLSKTITGANPLAETYAYDALNQLKQAKYGTARTVTYTYDASGNRQIVTDNGTAKAYSANALNQYVSVGGTPLTYDGNGNLASDTNGGTYQYDAQNRLVRAIVGGNTMTFAYDSRNRVVQRATNGTILNLTYDGWNLIEERDAVGGIAQVYVHGATVDEVLVKITASSSVYYLADGNGNVVALTDETGHVVETVTYDAFGTPTVHSSTGAVLKDSAYQNRFLFTGREWLSAVGLYDYRNRVYSAVLGRFLQTDPIRFSAGDRNIYRYVGNNPVNWSDPMGLASRQSRPLSGFGPIKIGPLRHDRFKYDDGSDSGYYDDGKIRPDKPENDSKYKNDGPNLDDSTLRQAESNVKNDGWENTPYDANPLNKTPDHQCQNYCDAVMDEYNRIKKENEDLDRISKEVLDEKNEKSNGCKN